jgi:hypothetical protein
MDGDLKKNKDVLPTVECNTTVAKEHVSEAERTIRTVKERTRGLVCTLPFTHIPRQMKIEFIYFMVFWLNAFPVKTGFSGVYSPRELLVQWRLDYNKHCRVLPGTYCEVHDEPVPSNTITSRTHAAIAMEPTGNLQGSVKFYCLTTGWIHTLPHARSGDQESESNRGQGKQGRTFRFLNRWAEPYKWTDEVPDNDSEFQGLLDKEETAPYPDISAEPPGVELESEESDFQLITDDLEPDFCELVAAALDNAGINPTERYTCYEREWSYAMHSDFELSVTNPDGSRSSIKQEEVATSKKTLGIYDAPSRGNQGHLEYIHGKLTAWITRMKNGHLPAHMAWIAYKLQLWPGLCYRLGTMTNDLEATDAIFDKDDYDMMPILGVVRTVKRELRKLHTTFGGNVFFHLPTEQLNCRINMLLQHYHTSTTLSKKLDASFRLLQLQLGTPYNEPDRDEPSQTQRAFFRPSTVLMA